MEKYYIAQLEASSGPDDATVVGRKLVGLQYARKPPTFGVLYLVNCGELSDDRPGGLAASSHGGYSDSLSDEDQDGDNNNNNFDAHDDNRKERDSSRRRQGGGGGHEPVGGANQSLKLAALNIIGDNSARFNISHEINLTEVTCQSVDNKQKQKQPPHQQQQHQADKVVDFSALNDQLLLELSHSNTSIEQQLQSSCFVLTQRGDLFVVSPIEPRGAKLLLNCTELANNNSSSCSSGRGKLSSQGRLQERFIEFKVIRRPAEEEVAAVVEGESEDEVEEDEDGDGDEDEEKEDGEDRGDCGRNAYNSGEGVGSKSSSNLGDRFVGQNRSYLTLSGHFLSDKCYYYCLIAIKNTKLDCDVRLLSKYSLRNTTGAHQRTNKSGRHQYRDTKSTTATLDPATASATASGGPLKFVQLLPIESRRYKSVVLLKLNDGTERIVKQSKCLHSTAIPTSGAAANSLAGQCCLALTPSSPDQTTILLSYSSHKLVANSLFIASHSGSGRNKQTNRAAAAAKLGATDKGPQQQWPSRQRARPLSGDPDGLLPPMPSFELEQCWSIDLSQIDGLRSAQLEIDGDDDDDHDHESEHEGHNGGDEGSDDGVAAASSRRGRRSSSSWAQKQVHGCLCPMWLGDVASSSKCNSDDVFGDNSSRCWPNYLLLAYSHHVLIYCFEQPTVLPFSIVYDRAFLQLDPARPGSNNNASRQHSASSQQHAKQQQQQLADKCVDLRVKPRLVHNFKLIGSAPGDSLFNMLFLTQRIHLHQLRCSNQLGFLVALSQLNHVLVFKLTSASIVKHKDNLYQQALLSAIRSDSLLSDEIQRIQSINNSLRHKYASLAGGSPIEPTTRLSTPSGPQLGSMNQSSMISLMLSSEAKQAVELLDRNSSGSSLEQVVNLSLKPDDTFGGLYSIQIEWLSSIGLKRLIILSSVNSRLLAPSSINGQQQANWLLAPSIKSFKVNNFDEDDSDDDNESGESGVDKQTRARASAKSTAHATTASNRALFLALELEGPAPGEATDDTGKDELADGERDSSEPLVRHKLRHLDCSKTKAWAVIELNTTRLRNDLASGPSHNSSSSGHSNPFTRTSLGVPILLTDGQFNGKLSVYFVFEATATPSSAFASHLQHVAAAGHVNQYYRDHVAHMQLQHNKDANHRDAASMRRQMFHRQHVIIKPLQSYRPTRHLGPDAARTSAKTTGGECEPCRLEIDGTFSDEQVFAWLNECLDIDSVRTSLQNQIQARITAGGGSGALANASDIRLRFSSNFTHCFIDIQISSASNKIDASTAASGSSTGSHEDRLAAATAASFKRQKASKLTIISDDFIALNLIEKRVFAEATNESIVLIKTNRQSPANIDNLRHLIGRQKINIDLYLSHMKKLSSTSSSLSPLRDGTRVGLGNNSDGQRQVELLLDTLLSEMDLQDMAIEPELNLSTDWLEKSLRQDIENVVLSQSDHDDTAKFSQSSGFVDKQERRAKSSSYLDTLIDMVCGFIIDALVDYDRLHLIKSTSATMIAMRSRLIKLIGEQTNDTLSGNNNNTVNQINTRSNRLFDVTLKQQQFANQVLAEWTEVKRAKKPTDSSNKQRA